MDPGPAEGGAEGGGVARSVRAWGRVWQDSDSELNVTVTG